MADSWNILSLCTGGGGLDRAVGLVVETARTVCVVEREAFALAVLASKAEALGVAMPPVWTDLTTFDGRPWRGVVDCVVAGIPCQPHSLAGKRLGAADERNLWPAAERVIREVEPPWVFLENVGGAVAFFGEHVLPGLERLGYRVEAGLFTASEVGAPHKRERLFVLAHRQRERRGDLQRNQEPTATRNDIRAVAGGSSVADTKPADGRRNRAERGPEGRAVVGWAGADVGNAAGTRHDEAWCWQSPQSKSGKRLSGKRGGDVADAERAEPGAGEPGIEGQAAAGGRHRPPDRGAELADAQGQRASTAEQPGQRCGLESDGRAVADASGAEYPQRQGQRQDDGEEREAPSGSGLPLFPPPPGIDLTALAKALSRARSTGEARAAAVFALGLARRIAGAWEGLFRTWPDLAPYAEPELRGVAQRLAPRADRLRLLGNGVCEAQGALAFATLLARLAAGQNWSVA